MEDIIRESMEFDVVIVGAGPAGLSAAIKIRQLAIENNLNERVHLMPSFGRQSLHLNQAAELEMNCS